MKHSLKFINVFLLISVLGLSSCFKEEAPNAECDILEAYLHLDDHVIDDYMYNPSDTLIRVPYSEKEISFTIKGNADLKHMAPRFRLTEGATVSPESGSIHDFSNGKKVKYVVTSESGKWQKEYLIGFCTSSIIPAWEFEHFELDPSDKAFYIWYSRLKDGGLASNWASGNRGYTLGAPKGTKPEQFPSSPEENGVTGKCLKLTTLSTGSMGKFAQKPIAGGSLWLGKFDNTKSLTDPMKSINFGVPFDQKPLKLTGYYKYKPGPVMTNKKMEEQPDLVDQPDIFAILYLNHDAEGKPICLYSDDAKTSPQLVAIAQVENLVQTSSWTQFEAEFQYLKTININTLMKQGYSLSVMFNSSKDGNIFLGAIGSELYIDSVKVECE